MAWESALDANGNAYYFDRATGETTWYKPEGFEEDEAPGENGSEGSLVDHDAGNVTEGTARFQDFDVASTSAKASHDEIQDEGAPESNSKSKSKGKTNRKYEIIRCARRIKVQIFIVAPPASLASSLLSPLKSPQK